MSREDGITSSAEVQAGQPSGGDNQTDEESKESNVILDFSTIFLSSSVRAKFSSMEDAMVKKKRRTKPAVKPLIRKVPFMLRDNGNSKKYYEPMVVAIGPIHHGSDNSKYSEKMKLRLAGHFIADYKIDKEVLWNKVVEETKNLRKCYAEEDLKDYEDDEVLPWMFLIDGCAMLQFIHCVVKHRLDQLNIKSDQVAFAQHDLFLLENQLPYQLLKLLMSLIVCDIERKAVKDSIKEFIRRNVMLDLAKEPELKEEEQPCHLLDLLRKSLIVEPQKGKTCNIACSWKKCREKLQQLCKRGYGSRTASDNWQTFRSVSELKASGIRLERSSGSLKDIDFQRIILGVGFLKLPPLIVDDSTGAKLLNLIAYEMCPDFDNQFEVCSYVYFLDSLIDQTDDVKELRKNGILLNVLGSDGEVAKLFNDIGNNLIENPDIYGPVKKKIEEHSKGIMSNWIAQFIHNHFSSPWTFLAFLAAMLGLVSSFIQTWYTLHPKQPPTNS